MVTSNAVTAEKYIKVDFLSIPNGRYSGYWGGSEATALIDGEQYRFIVSNGIRTMKAECTIIVNDGNIRVEA